MHLIDTTGPGGAETVFIQLADLLRQRGYRSLVVIHGPGWVHDELQRRGLAPLVVAVTGGFAVGLLWQLLRLVRREKVDVIQSHLLGSNVYAAMVGLLARVPVVATYHGMVDINPRERFRRIKHRAMKWGIRRYVTVSRRLLDSVCAQNLLDPDKTTVVYNGIETEKYRPNQSSRLRRQLQVADDALLVGSLGNIRSAKAYDVLIEAAARVVPDYPNLHFIVAGHQKEPLMSELNRQVVELGLADHIHFIGFYEDSADFLGQLDYFVLCSSSEGFSISTIEAMATGLPVLVTRCGGPEEIVSHGENGWMVPPGDPAALAQALAQLIADAGLSHKLGAAGLAHVRNTFDVQAMLNGYEAIYTRL
ncbi:glycosyltransferase [Exilibacterium tricleocarpae]|uniref:glycosyltransferase n=1 Tax=Exilibacterium tricleocarpae TaxID=2591008 RepID=UPI0015D2404D|nr:glycosyltransferase [Exilibacterium tricleocarpae]